MALLAPPVADERAGYAAFLSQQQEAIRALVHGLTDAEAFAAPSASEISLGWLVKHLTMVQRSWLASVLAAPEAAPRVEGSDEVTPQDTLIDLLAGFDAVSADVLTAVRQTDPQVSVPVPDAPWFPKDVGTWSVRWVWLHLIEELARHAGHGDIVRETLDGATMYPLMAAHTGLPATPWLQPWQRTDPPVATGISTTTLAATDVPAAKAWYAQVLQAPVGFENPHYVEFSLGPHEHEFGIVDAAFTDGPVVYLWVPQVQVATDRFVAAGATVQHAPRDFTGEGRYLGAVLVDPFGNRIGLMQRPHPGPRRA